MPTSKHFKNMKNLKSNLYTNHQISKPFSSTSKLSSLILLSFFIFVGLTITLFLSNSLRPVVSSYPTLSKKSMPIIIIDAGHGGADPGKIGTKGTLEKELNLNIALSLKKLLEAQDMTVIITRDNDTDLATDSANFKSSDMKNRISIIQKSNADIVVSIHQNSYPDSRIYGAQCFYYSPSEEGKKLANSLQKQIISSTNQTKIREIKGNEDYYILKHSDIPTVIVECGFLSNPQEEQLLLTTEYQRKMAWAIHLGILTYLNS